jgi:hypothetical protein
MTSVFRAHVLICGDEIDRHVDRAGAVLPWVFIRL